jgi:hypothetical protein
MVPIEEARLSFDPHMLALLDAVPGLVTSGDEIQDTSMLFWRKGGLRPHIPPRSKTIGPDDSIAQAAARLDGWAQLSTLSQTDDRSQRPYPLRPTIAAHDGSLSIPHHRAILAVHRQN